MPGLQLTGYTSLQNGATTSTGFAKVVGFNGNEVNFNLDVAIWVDETSKLNNLSPIDHRTYTIPTTMVTGTAPLYTYLSSLPEYSGSTIVE